MATSGVCSSRRRIKLGGLTPLAVKMASRTQEIRPVGAWVEPATQHDCSAVVSAEIQAGVWKRMPLLEHELELDESTNRCH